MQELYKEFAENTKFVLCIDVPSFEFFNRFYTEEHRYYHNFDHLKQMLNIANIYVREIGIEDFSLVQLFIWWHDIIYDPKRKDNEQTSAELFKYCSSKLNRRSLTEVYNTIMDSRHLVEPSNRENWSLFCLDLDLSAMIDKDAFKNNGFLIRKEFSHVPDVEFFKSRKGFFEALCNRPKLFYNPYRLSYFETGENSARQNIQQELEFLSNLTMEG